MAKVPENFSMKDCYSRIYDWHMKHGRERIKIIYKRQDNYSDTYLKLLDALPSPDKATTEDMAFIFGEVLHMLMEWSYNEEDGHRIKIAAYAHFALRKFFNDNMQQLREAAERSRLHDQFGLEKWKK